MNRTDTMSGQKNSMRRIGTAIVLLSLLITSGDYTWSQATGDGICVNPVSRVAISVAPVAGTSKANSDLKVRVSITNSTNRILVDRYPIQTGAVQIEIHDASGTLPVETDFGCKRHMSKKCGSRVKFASTVSFAAMVVMPGQTLSFNYALGQEYKLDKVNFIVIDAVAMGFVLVDAPKSITEAPVPLRNQYLSNYEQYSHTKLVPFRSKAITLRVSH